MITTTETVHCFEKAGLGKAPFRYAGMAYQDICYGQRVIGSVGGIQLTTKPGGTCAYCGTYIVNMFNVESADGHRFHVGCECIRKTGDEGLIKRVNDDVKRAERERRQAKRIAKENADETLCRETQLGLLAGKPHPTPARAANGETLADWARFMIAGRYFKSLAVVIRRELPAA